MLRNQTLPIVWFVPELLPLLVDNTPQFVGSGRVKRTPHHRYLYAPPNKFTYVEVGTLQGQWEHVDLATFQEVADFVRRVNGTQIVLKHEVCVGEWVLEDVGNLDVVNYVTVTVTRHYSPNPKH